MSLIPILIQRKRRKRMEIFHFYYLPPRKIEWISLKVRNIFCVKHFLCKNCIFCKIIFLGLHDSGILPELINQQDQDGYSALHRAAYSNAFQASVFLLEKGSSVTLKTNDGWTPLHSAARWNWYNWKKFYYFLPVNWLFSSQVAALLLSHGADVNAKTNGGTTPIQLAVSEKNYNAVVEGKIFNYCTSILKIEEPHFLKNRLSFSIRAKFGC